MTDACYCDYDAPLFYRAEVRSARKQHRCEECGRAVAPGERYEHVASIQERGDPIMEFKTCCRCLAVREWVQAHVPCFCWYHGSMLDDAKETMGDYACEAPGLWVGFGRRYIAALGRRAAAAMGGAA